MVGRARAVGQPAAPSLSWVLSRLRSRMAFDRVAAGLALALALIAFAAAAAVMTTVSDRLPHLADEVTYLFQAETYASGRLTLPAPPLADSFFLPFVLVDHGRWFGKYTPGYPLVLALGSLIHRPWLVNPLVGALDVVLLYLLGRRLYGAGTGLLAAALLVASPFFLLQSGSYMSHPVALLWTLLFLLLTARGLRDGGLWSGLGAGAALGMLLLTRPLTAVAIGLPVGLFLLTTCLRRGGRRLPRVAPLLLGFLPFAVATLAYNQLTTGHPLLFAYQVYWPFDTIGFGSNHGLYGFTPRQAVHDLRQKLSLLSVYLYGWPWRLSLLPATIAAGSSVATAGRAVWARLRRGERVALARATTTDLILLSLCLSVAALYFAYWGNDAYRGPRYYYELLGALTLLSARGLLRLGDWLESLRRRSLPALPLPLSLRALTGPAVVLLVVAGLSTWSVSHSLPEMVAPYDNYYNINDAGLRTIQAAHLHNAVVFVASNENPYAWPDYVPYFFQNPVTLDGNVVYALDLGDSWDGLLLQTYPGRTAYRFAHGQLEPLFSEP